MTWWTKNPDKAEVFLAKKADRYKTDEIYRENIKRRVRARRERLKGVKSETYSHQRRVIFKDDEFVVLLGAKEILCLFNIDVLELVSGGKLNPVMKDTSGRCWFDISQVKKALEKGIGSG